MAIDKVLLKIKSEFERAITTARFNGNVYDNGNKAKEALIRSQKLINYIHQFVKQEFIQEGVNKKRIVPPLNSSKPEVKIEGLLKSKNQDISLIPSKVKDDYEKILTVNVRSQLSSMAKNIDTLYERTFAEALNLHLSYPKQCLGEVYLIPTHEYDDKAMVANKVLFKKVSKIENYITMFQEINNRNTTNGVPHKYERVCLLIVDFRNKNPKLYSNENELKVDELIPANSKVSMEKLSINNFARDLLSVYSQRFDLNKLKS